MKRFLTFLLFIISCSLFVETQATIRYVRQVSYGNGSGSSWTNASSDLQLMINNSSAGDSVFVAEGTYLPIRPANNLNTIDSNNRLNAYVLKGDVKIFGGFPDNDTATWTDRNWGAYPSILSGDIGVPNRRSDNCLHVVIVVGNSTTAYLDGFRITGGNDNDNYYGIFINGVYMSGYWGGGGILLRNSLFQLTNAIVSGNLGGSFGGGIYTHNSTSVLTNVVISGNSADNHGGISHGNYSSTTLINVTVSGNKTYNGCAGGIGLNAESTVTIRNSIVWGNTSALGVCNNISDHGTSITKSLIQGDNNTNNTYPQFISPAPAANAPTTAGNYRLSICSPAIDAGNNTYITDSLDLDANPRIYKGTVDLGAYEYQGFFGTIFSDTIEFASLSFIYSGIGQTPNITSLSERIPILLYKRKNASDYTYSPNMPVNAGDYTIKASLPSIPSIEMCEYTDIADFVILPKDITVKANGGTSVYGENPPANPKFTATGLVNGETESVLTELYNDFSINNTTPAGTYMLSVAGTLTNTNYNITAYDTGTWIVNKRPLTIKAISDTIYYGQTPVLRYEIVSGSLVNGDVLSGALSVDNYEVGTHTIGQGTLTAGDNYVITFIDGTLLVWSIQDVFVDNKLSERHKNYFQFDSDCGKNEVSVYVTCYQCVKILINGIEQNPCTVALPHYGDNNILITVIAQNSDAETHTLTINRPIPFDQIVKMHCDNTITAINNPANNGGFNFTSYKWFCNDKKFSENQSWSASNQWWQASDLFHLELTATGYSGILRTCKSRISLKDMELHFYPNPVMVGETLYLKSDMDNECLKDAVIEIYDMSGRLVASFPLTSMQIPIGYNYESGIYFFIIKGKDKLRKEYGIIVYG